MSIEKENVGHVVVVESGSSAAAVSTEVDRSAGGTAVPGGAAAHSENRGRDLSAVGSAEHKEFGTAEIELAVVVGGGDQTVGLTDTAGTESFSVSGVGIDIRTAQSVHILYIAFFSEEDCPSGIGGNSTIGVEIVKNRTGIETVVGVAHGIEDGFHGLPLIADTGGSTGAAAGVADSGDGDTGENGNNGDNSKQFGNSITVPFHIHNSFLKFPGFRKTFQFTLSLKYYIIKTGKSQVGLSHSDKKLFITGPTKKSYFFKSAACIFHNAAVKYLCNRMTTFTFCRNHGDFMSSQKQQSMKELAAYTGFSIASISRALDPKRAYMVKGSTRQKIDQAVKELNFSVNLSARRLKIQRTEVISVAILRSPFGRSSYSYEFAPQAMTADDIQHLGEVSRKYGYDLKLEFFNEYEPLSEQFFDRSRTDGIIFSAYCGNDYDRIIAKSGLPAVFMSRYIDIEHDRRNFVGLNREPGFRQAVESLNRCSMDKIGWIGIPRTAFSRNSRIVEMLLREKNLFNEKYFFDIKDFYQLREIITELAPLDAIFCGNDTIADWTAREFRYRDLKSPLLIGYDNDPYFREQKCFNSIGHHGNPMPELAVKMLDQLICNSSAKSGPISETVNCEYIERVQL